MKRLLKKVTGFDGGDGVYSARASSGRGHMTIHPRIPTMPERRASGFHQPSRHGFAPSAKRHEVFVESHKGRTA